MEEDLVRTVDDFPIGSVWIDVDSFVMAPVLVVDHWRPRPVPTSSIDYFVYVDLETGRKSYCLVGSRSIELFVRVA